MITSTRTAARLMIIARPNCSASWQQFAGAARPRRALAGAATGFALRGAWPILPLAGLELLALGSALYYVNWKLQYRHVITLSDDSVCIDKGFYAPTQTGNSRASPLAWAIIPERHPWEGRSCPAGHRRIRQHRRVSQPRRQPGTCRPAAARNPGRQPQCAG